MRATSCTAPRSRPCVTLTGPRQSGKTTLCRTVFPQHRYVSLEAVDVRAFASEDPRGFLAQFPDGAVIACEVLGLEVDALVHVTDLGLATLCCLGA